MHRHNNRSSLTQRRPPLHDNHKGFSILLRAQRDDSRKLFSPFLAFSWQLWVALVGTAVAVSLVLWLLDTSVRAMDRVGEEEDEEEDDGSSSEGDDECPMCRCRKCGVHGKLWKQRSTGTDVEGGTATPGDAGTLKPQVSDAASQLSAMQGRHLVTLLELLQRAHGKQGIKSLKSLGANGQKRAWGFENI